MIKISRLALPLASSLTALALALTASPALADHHASKAMEAEQAPMTAQDLVTMPRLGSPAVTADGRFAVYSVTETDPESYERKSSLYLLDLTAEMAVPVKLDLSGSANSAAFAADNFLYFLSGRASDDAEEGAEGTSQVWRAALEADGNVTGPTQVTALPAAVDGFHISPDASHIAVFGAVSRKCTSFGCDDDGTTHLPGPGSARLYEGDGGFYRHWDHWETTETLNRIFAFPMQEGIAIGDGVALDGPDGEGAFIGNSPTMPFGGGEDIAWAADSKSIFFSARKADSSEPMSTNVDIYHSDLSGSAPANLTEANQAYDSGPTPSPDGKYLAYVAMERAGYEADRLVVHLRDLASGETRAITDGFDRSFGSLAWTEDSQYIIASAQDVLDTPAFRIDPLTGGVERLDLMAGNEAHIGNVTPIGDGDFLFTRDSIGSPSELYFSRGGALAEPLTDVATSRVSNLAATVTTRFSFEGAGGDTVWGQITKLAGHDGPMPAILYVHGGPQGSFNDGWSSRWNPRVVASQGYAVVSVDFHGSSGYGQDFTDSINRDWGGKPLEDLQKGLAAALAEDSQIDGSRTCAMGASYGGYMMNWIAGKWPDRFNCLVQHDGLFDMRSFYYTTEELWFPRWDFGGSYAEATESYERWNPAAHVDDWQTPMLVITGERDFRVPYTQGIASFTALQERDIPSQLLVFPDENHWVLKPKNSLQWHNTVFNWLDRWLAEADTAGE